MLRFWTALGMTLVPKVCFLKNTPILQLSILYEVSIILEPLLAYQIVNTKSREILRYLWELVFTTKKIRGHAY